MPPTASFVRRGRVLAKRSCLTCREKKSRCELPDLYVPSSHDALPPNKRCHRCKVLDLDCVVYDGDRKRKPRLPSPSSASSQSNTLQADEEQHAKLVSRRSTPHADVPIATLFGPPSLESSSSPFQSVFQPSAELLTASPSAQVSPGSSGPADLYVIAAASNLLSDQINTRSWRALLRPILALIDVVSHSSDYIAYLNERIAVPTQLSAVTIVDLLDRDACRTMDSSLSIHMVWHPYLSSLEAVFAAPRTTSSELLLATMALVAARHTQSESSSLICGLSALVDRLGTHALLSSTRDIHIAQAFDLLLAHDPPLVGTAVSPHQDKRSLGLAGDSLLGAALEAAHDSDVDTALSRLQAGHSPSADLLAKASLWISLLLWKGHYAFLKPTVKPLEGMDTVASLANSHLCCITDDGRPIHPQKPTRTPHLNKAHLPEDVALLRSSGRTILAHRMQAMAVVHSSLLQIRDATSNSTQAQPCPGPNTPRDPSLLKKLNAIALFGLDRLKDIEQSCYTRMAAFVLLSDANLAETWSRMEAAAFGSLICRFATMAGFTGKFEQSFSGARFFEEFFSDEMFRNLISEIGILRNELAETVTSILATFDRVIGAAQRRVTGAPLFLTCALLLDSCKVFLETTSFVLVSYGSVDRHFFNRVVILRQAAARLDEFQGSKGICAVTASHVREMAEQMEKWNFAASLYRSQGLTQRRPKETTSPEGWWPPSEGMFDIPQFEFDLDSLLAGDDDAL